MKRKVLLTLSAALISTMALAAEDARDVRSKEDDARAQQQVQADGARMEDANSSNAHAALLNDLANSGSPGAQRAATIFARQTNLDLPEANVRAMEDAVKARKAAGMSSVDALNAELQARNSDLNKFATKDEGCGE